MALASSVLTSIPVHSMKTMWIPKIICDGIDRIVSQFIWKSSENGCGFHLVNWNNITCPKMHGGLGIREAHSNNVALLGKLIWNLLNDREKLSSQVLLNKYVPQGHFFDQSNLYGSSYTWRFIFKL